MNLNLKDNPPFKSDMAEIVFLRTYSKLLKNGRKERWGDTVERYFNYMKFRFPKIQENDLVRVKKMVLEGEVMPSMRLMQFAGSTIDKLEVSAYNCSYVSIDNILAISELLYLNMSGVGIGFSVENSVIDKLPIVQKNIFKAPFKFPVTDSTFGWVRAYKIYIRMIFSGCNIELNYDLLRPKGAKIKRGGFSSGPEGISSLIEGSQKIFKKSEGRKLKSIEIYDLIMLGTYSVSGGAARRVAAISLSDLDDEEMKFAKTGKFYLENPQRNFCNNSVKYLKKPSWEKFNQEMKSLIESGSGERGILNLTDLSKMLSKRRKKVPREFLGVNPCGEIILRSCQFCNLSEIILREEDNEETLLKKIEAASLLGTWQSMFLNFDERVLRKKWRVNCEEERLLGVSMTGLADCFELRSKLKDLLPKLKNKAIEVNFIESKRLGINPSASITCIKPSGTVSTIMDTSPGLHPRFSKFYIRRIRFHKQDPMLKSLNLAGFKIFQDPYSDIVVYLEFPIKSPKNSITQKEIGAIGQLESWKIFKTSYTEHNPSMTCYVREHEWEEVKNWIWNNWEWVGGISFLPFTDHIYEAAPYEEISEKEFSERIKKLKEINWDILYGGGEDTRSSVAGCDNQSY